MLPRSRPRRAARVTRAGIAAGAAAVLAASLAAALPASADHSEAPQRVTLMGDLMSELGCEGDWDEACSATDLAAVDGSPGVYAGEFEVPAGQYQYKVRLDGSWQESYGDPSFGLDGGNVPLVLAQPASLRFVYDHAAHSVRVGPADPAGGTTDADRELAGDSLREDLTREQFYFVLADRFANGDTGNDTAGISGDRLQHGYDPQDKAFYHGGDLRGLIERLDYIEGMGTTAIWMTPSFQNKPVQGAPGSESAGYHGYWITDFTRIDPHLGTNAELAELVDEAHARGIKVFFDIITNHTADVLDYPAEAYDDAGQVPYVTKAAEPYRDAEGRPFDDRDHAGTGDFPAVDTDSFPYAPTFRNPADAEVKTPAWLNDPTMYHNRGTSTFSGENSEYGDFPSGQFSALDDLWTERPEVVDGMVDIYSTWVEEAGVDGFRIDTVKHVNMEFWQQFGPALEGYAASLGNEDFFMFGEVYDADPRFMSRYTTEGRLQAAVDFGFQGTGVNFAKGAPTTQLRDFYALDDYYTDADSNAYSMPTFLGNHDMGRVGSFLRQEFPDAADAELLQRDRLAHSLMYLTRGQPVVYYGDEQGFNTAGESPDGGPGEAINDQIAREDVFASEVDSYNDNDLIGTDATTATDNYDADHPLYRHLAELSELREQHPALADGAQLHRFASDTAGVYAFSRIDADQQVEYVVAVNNDTTERTAGFGTSTPDTRFRPVWAERGTPLHSDAAGRVEVRVPALSAVVYRADRPVPADDAAPEPVPTTGPVVTGRAEVGVTLPAGGFSQASFAWRPVGTQEWRRLGTDDNAPYRVFHDVRDLALGTPVEYRAVVTDADGDLTAVSSSAVVGNPQPPQAGGGVPLGPVEQPDAVSVPGSHGSEAGCTGALDGDWQPGCDAVQLTRGEDDVWTATLDLPAGQYAFKAAIDRSWEENYGVGGMLNGSDVSYATDGGEVTFRYDHRTHWVTNSELTPLLTAVGDFQSELGCGGDDDPGCLRSWLQDPDGDGSYAFSSLDIPAGSYQVGVSQEGGPAGPTTSFTVPEGEATTISYRPGDDAPTVETFVPDLGPDLGTDRAAWLARDLVGWDLPDERGRWTYRLHHGPAGSLRIDAETLGGTSVPLRLDGTLSEQQAASHPRLAGAEALRLSERDARQAARIARSAQIAVAAYDELGRLVRATGVEVGAGLPGRPRPTPTGG